MKFSYGKSQPEISLTKTPTQHNSLLEQSISCADKPVNRNRSALVLTCHRSVIKPTGFSRKHASILPRCCSLNCATPSIATMPCYCGYKISQCRGGSAFPLLLIDGIKLLSVKLQQFPNRYFRLLVFENFLIVNQLF